jgi:hypothetical protein
MDVRNRTLVILVALVAAALGGLAPAGFAHAQEPDTTAAPVAPADTGAGDTLRAEAPETYFMVDTIIVVEDVRGLVWGDWYVNPEVGTQVGQAIRRRGQLAGRTWLESAAPIRDLALSRPSGETQALSFVDKGVAVNFWEPNEVEYAYVFEGPFGLRAKGSAGSDPAVGADHVRILLPLREPPDRASLEVKNRVGRLDISYRPTRAGGTIPRGKFSIYLYYLNPQLGYRIVGVGY